MIWRDCIMDCGRPCSFKLIISEQDEEETILNFCSLWCVKQFVDCRLGRLGVGNGKK